MKATEPLKKRQQKTEDIIANANAHNFMQPSSTHTKKKKKKKNHMPSPGIA